VLAVRPEKMRLVGEGAGGNSFPGTLELVTYLGSITEYAVRLASGETVNVHAHNAGDSDQERFTPGAQVRVGWEPESCQLLA
jgi:ABC-type Fe3+/spermidine/putrescine transport system ATPase subunit